MFVTIILYLLVFKRFWFFYLLGLDVDSIQEIRYRNIIHFHFY